MASKRKLSVTLDAELVDALEADAAAVSVQVNDAVRAEVERRRRQRGLERFCDQVVDETGPWTAADEAEIARIMGLLSA